MGIFDILWGKHGHRKDKHIQELLAEIKRQEENETLLILNEKRCLDEVRRLMEDIRTLRKENEKLERWLYRCQHPPKRAVTFDVVFS